MAGARASPTCCRTPRSSWHWVTVPRQTSARCASIPAFLVQLGGQRLHGWLAPPSSAAARHACAQRTDATCRRARGGGAQGATDSERVCVTVGTSAAMRCVVHSPTPPTLQPGLWSYRISRDRHLVRSVIGSPCLGGCMHGAATDILTWLWDLGDINRSAARSPTPARFTSGTTSGT
jgi:hypothetical protein